MSSDAGIDLSKLTGARQTMLSWSKPVESFEDIPEVFRDSFKTTLVDARPFPYTVFAPSIPGLRRKVTEKMICQANDGIYIWEHLHDEVTLVEYPLHAISDIEIGKILLYSWLTISGATKSGEVSSTTIEFNTATARHYSYFINKMRPTPIEMTERDWSTEKAKLDYLTTDSFKFMNFAIESLMGGERILKVLSQPKISKPVLRLGDHILYQTTLSMAHLILLTDQEFILIEDDERSSEVRGTRYGGKWRYIPLRSIKAVSLHEHADDLLTLSLTLRPADRPLDIIFEPSRKQELSQFQIKLEKLID